MEHRVRGLNPRRSRAVVPVFKNGTVNVPLKDITRIKERICLKHIVELEEQELHNGIFSGLPPPAQDSMEPSEEAREGRAALPHQ